MDTATLHRLLDRQLGLPPEYGGALASHVPMGLQALHAMGASPARLDEFARRASEAEFRGEAGGADFGEFHALRAGFARTIGREGRDAALRRALPALMPGVAAAAFHGAIRTAHAIEAGHDGELAAALAYWSWRSQPLAEPPAGAPLAFADWAARLVLRAPAWRHESRSIALRMAAAVDSAPYRELGAALEPVPDLLQRLAAFAAERYAATANFTVLHMVTGLRALRVVSRWLDDVDAALLVRAFVAAYLAARVPAAPPMPPRRAGGWPEILAAACRSDDPHAIKLVHACREQETAYGPGPWLEAAAVAVG